MTAVLAVGIGGGSGSGKTTLCRALAKLLPTSVILDLDSYYLDRSGVSPERRADLNFDEPAAFDVSLLVAHLEDLRNGRPVEKPRYSFRDHSRCGSESIHPGRILLVEGLFSFWWEEVRPLLDFKVFVDAPADVRLARRLRRDVESRGRNVQSVLQQYEDTVRPNHDRYVEPTRELADVVVVNDGDFATCVMSIHAALPTSGEPSGRSREDHASTA